MASENELEFVEEITPQSRLLIRVRRRSGRGEKVRRRRGDNQHSREREGGNALSSVMSWCEETGHKLYSDMLR